jgi:uncharacterized protein with HEPN domain
MHRDREYLLDILKAARLAISYIGGKTKEDFLKDTQCQDAVIRRLEVIGEAARRISDGTIQRFPRLPWREMIGMRNVMIHGYDDIDLVVVWKTVTDDIPRLVDSLEEILSE